MKKILEYGLAVLAIASAFVANAKAADPIADLNQIVETVVKAVGYVPSVVVLDFAIVYLAIYDAVESIDR